MDIHIIDYLPAWALTFINPKSENGIVFVELATCDADKYNRPSFLLFARENPQLFRLFKKEFENLLTESRTA